MKNSYYLVACIGLFNVPIAHAQSSVILYGILDAGLQYTNNVANGGSLIRLTTGNINGDRFGMRGIEDLGGDLSALVVLEGGFSINNGNSAQDGRLFGRQAYVGLKSTQYGQISLGRQYDALTDTLIPLAATAIDFGDTAFAHPFDNDEMIHSFRLSNTVKYVSPMYRGLKLETQYAFSNSADFALNRAYSAGLPVQPHSLTGYLKLCGASRLLPRLENRSACSTRSTSSLASRVAVSPHWHTGCMAKNCSTFTRRASSNAMCKAS